MDFPILDIILRDREMPTRCMQPTRLPELVSGEMCTTEGPHAPSSQLPLLCQAHSSEALAHVQTSLASLQKSTFPEHSEATGIENENGSEPVLGCPGINPAAVRNRVSGLRTG